MLLFLLKLTLLMIMETHYLKPLGWVKTYSLWLRDSPKLSIDLQKLVIYQEQYCYKMDKTSNQNKSYKQFSKWQIKINPYLRRSQINLVVTQLTIMGMMKKMGIMIMIKIYNRELRLLVRSLKVKISTQTMKVMTTLANIWGSLVQVGIHPIRSNHLTITNWQASIIGP